MSGYKVSMLGPPLLEGRTGPIQPTSRTALSLLWYLAAQPDQAFSRSHLSGILWPDAPEALGHSRLSVVLTRLRQSLPTWPLLRSGDTLRWDPENGIALDTWQFSELTRAAGLRRPRAAEVPPSAVRRELLARAVALWRGPLLQGVEDQVNERYEEWLQQERHHWEQWMLEALVELVREEQADGDWQAMISHCDQALHIDALQERFHCWLMEAYCQSGDRAAALTQYATCAEILRVELGVAPDPRTTALREQIVHGQVPRAEPQPTLLAKMLPPEPVVGLVERRLVDELAAEARVRNLLVVAAGAGYGKTSLLAAVARRHRPVAWLSLTDADRDPDVYLEYLGKTLAHALGQAPPPAAARFSAAAGGAAGPRLHSAAAMQLAAWLSGCRMESLLLVLDDYHRVEAVPEIGQLMQTLLENMPTGLHVALGTRVVPHLLLLSRWQAMGRAAVIGEGALRFGRDEAADLLRVAHGLTPGAQTLEQLLTATEGWVLGLQLLGQVMRERQEREPGSLQEPLLPMLPEGVGGSRISPSLLFDYFAAEVLRTQPDDRRSFLEAAAILDVMTPAACDAVSGRDDSWRLLRDLEQQGLFLVRIGDAAWRFHNLFRTFLRRELAAHRERHLALEQAAGQYLTVAGQLEEAVPHWLAAGNYRRAAEGVHRAASRITRVGRHATLAHWLELFPPQHLEQYPQLLFWRGYLLEAQGQRDQAVAWYRRAEAGYRRQADIAGQVEVHHRLAYMAVMLEGLPRKGHRHATIALRLLTQSGAPDNGDQLLALTLVYMGLGRPDRARFLARRALAAHRRDGNRWGEALALLAACWPEFIAGDFAASLALLDEAGRLFSEAEAPHFEAERLMHRAAILVYSGRYEEAREVGERALSLASRLNSPPWQAAAQRMLGWAWQFGPGADAARAARYLEQAISLGEALGDARTLGVAGVAALRLAYRGGDPAATARALARCEAYLKKCTDRHLLAQAAVHGGLVLAKTDPARAEELLRWSLRTMTAIGDRYHQALAHLGLAILTRGDPSQLAEHLPGAQAAFSHFGGALLGDDFADAFSLAMEAARGCGLTAGDAAPPGESLPSAAELAIRTLGRFAVTLAGTPVPEAAWGNSRASELLQLLAAHHPQPVPAEQVLAALWGHLPPGPAENNLKKTLHRLRQVLGAGANQVRDRHVLLQAGTLGLAHGTWVDVAEFTAHVRLAQRLAAVGKGAATRRECRAAERLWTGDFLAGDPYAEWARERRQRVRHERFWVLEKLAEAAAAAGDYLGAGLYLRRILDADPTQEGASRRLMEYLYRAGHPRQAREQYRQCYRILRRELGVKPAPETRDLYRRLFGGQPTGGRRTGLSDERLTSG